VKKNPTKSRKMNVARSSIFMKFASSRRCKTGKHVTGKERSLPHCCPSRTLIAWGDQPAKLRQSPFLIVGMRDITEQLKDQFENGPFIPFS
jgi:hypothetical protein